MVHFKFLKHRSKEEKKRKDEEYEQRKRERKLRNEGERQITDILNYCILIVILFVVIDGLFCAVFGVFCPSSGANALDLDLQQIF